MTDDELISAAFAALEHSYSPYSSFRVGAALLDTEGRVHPGANIENASYGLTICAERVAVGLARMAGMTGISTIAVVTDHPHLTAPCGACRQVIREFGPEARILLANRDGARRVFTLGDLLPESFGPEDLGKEP